MKLNDEQKKSLKEGAILSVAFVVAYILFSVVFKDRSVMDALEGGIAGFVGMWVMLGLIILGSRKPQK
ncbi:MAG: hypothetical protein Q4D12_04345 [Bacteroidales bacterium]|nr:hypothetical protein [Bacteroidales bacterium]